MFQIQPKPLKNYRHKGYKNVASHVIISQLLEKTVIIAEAN